MVHSTASGWVGRIASQDKGHASSLYLLAYYGRASIMGWSGGWARSDGWNGVTAFVAVTFGIVLGIAVLLMRANGKVGRATT